MQPCHVEVVAPSRLHFGLMSFGQRGTRQYGGAGVMIARPGLRLAITPARCFTATGPLSGRAAAVAERYAPLVGMSSPPACQLTIIDAPEEHVGLGTGTQLALAVVAGLNAFQGGETLPPAELAALTGRGRRSAVGTYGFVSGGLLVETGKREGETLAPLAERMVLPSGWRFVLIRPRGEPGLSGNDEISAFENLPPVSRSITEQLLQELSQELLPAAAAGQFERFSESVYRYGHTAGMCFASGQGGAFASPRLEALVNTIRSLGVRGTGQSSWGPTLFALLESSAAAEHFVNTMRGQLDRNDAITIAEPNNHGAQILRRGQP